MGWQQGLCVNRYYSWSRPQKHAIAIVEAIGAVTIVRRRMCGSHILILHRSDPFDAQDESITP